MLTSEFFRQYKEYFSGKKVLVTGGLGFLGSNLVLALVKMNAKVTILDGMLDLYGGNYFNIEPVKDSVDIHVADIRDKSLLDWLVKGQDYIFHIAAQTSHVDSMIDPLTDIDMNCRGTMMLLEACREHNPDVKLVYCGTRGQYGKLDYTPVDEKHKMLPVDVYGINKMAGELYCLLYHRVHGLKSLSLRVNNTYGPRHQMKHGKYGILNWFIRLAMDNGTIKVFGEGNQLRDYNYVDDVTRAFIMSAACEDAYGKAFNLGSGNPIAFIELVKLILKTADSGSMEQTPWPKERADIEVGDYVADFNLLKNTCGWEPYVNLEEGLRKTVDYYKKHKEFYWK
jgi:UDP-glucose 4-epimerase